MHRLFYYLKNIYSFILEKGGGREKGREEQRERNINVWLLVARPQPGTWPATQTCALTVPELNR